MESVFFLIDTLDKQIISLNDLSLRCERLMKLIKETYTTLQYAKSLSKVQSRQVVLQQISGGSSFDVDTLMNFDQSLTEPENLMNFFYQVLTIWPFIKSKSELASSSVKSALSQAKIAEKLALALKERLDDSVMKNQVDKITLIAFNSDMAQLDARVSIVIYVIKSLFEDMTDLKLMLSFIVPISTNESLKPTLSLLNKLSESLFSTTNEMNEIVKNAVGAPLINPRLLEMTKDSSKVDQSALSIESLSTK